MAEDKRKNNGGHPTNGGRKPIADEKKVNNLFVTALKELYSTDKEDDAKVKFIKETLLDSQRGQLFVAEHIFGKPKETIETTHNLNNFDIKELFNFDNDKT